MFEWLIKNFFSKLLESQKVKLAIGGTLTALAFKAAAFVSGHFGLMVTPDAATINHFVDWIFGLTATMIGGHAMQAAFGDDVPPPPNV